MWLTGNANCHDEKAALLWSSSSNRWWIIENGGIGGEGWGQRRRGRPKNKGLVNVIGWNGPGSSAHKMIVVAKDRGKWV